MEIWVNDLTCFSLTDERFCVISISIKENVVFLTHVIGIVVFLGDSGREPWNVLLMLVVEVLNYILNATEISILSIINSEDHGVCHSL